MSHTPKLADAKKLIGHKIAAMRKKKGYTQERLAEATQISHAHLASIEIGKHAPRLDTMLKIVSELDVKVSDLIPF
jgi:transcriptional regulator with XRE-family HTH domain